MPLRFKTTYKRFALLLFSGLALLGCSIVVDSDDYDPQWNDRRMYVNDIAANDSLNAAILNGVNFFMQPGSNYTLKIKGALPLNTKLHIFKLYDRWFERSGSPLEASGSNGDWTFQLSCPYDVPSYFWAVLDHPAMSEAGLAEDVLFKGAGPYPEVRFGVNYHFVGQYSNHRQSQLKSLAERMHEGLKNVYESATGIVVNYGGAVIHGGAAAVTVNFPMDYAEAPKISGGQQGYINMVFVESIKTEGSGLIILGFSPREGTAVNHDPENILLLSLSLQESRVINTMAHELGHFFGLRHTVATEQDLNNEKDWSNTEDGFSDTEFCQLGSISALSKLKGHSSSNYCIRVAAPAKTYASCNQNAKRNLMFPMEDRTLAQNQLSDQQVEFIKSNLSVLKR